MTTRRPPDGGRRGTAGFGVAVALLIDATIVRAVLVTDCSEETSEPS